MPGKLRFAPHLSTGLHLGNLYSLTLIDNLAHHINADLIWRLDGFDYKNMEESIFIFRKQLANLRFLYFNFYKFYLPPTICDDKLLHGPLRPFMYECFETHEELIKWRLRVGPKTPFTESSKFAAPVGKGCWRFNLKKAKEKLTNLCQESLHEDWTKDDGFLASTSDPILIRPDGSLTYLLSSVLSDIREGINIVVRGNDLVPSAKVQSLIFSALGHSIHFYHHGLLLTSQGKLSKRSGDMSLDTLVQANYPLTAFQYWVGGQIKKQARPLVKLISGNNRVIKWETFLQELNLIFLKLSYRQIKLDLPKDIDSKAWYHLKTVVRDLSELKSLRLTDREGLACCELLTLEEVKTFLRLISRLYLGTGHKRTPSVSWLINWRPESYLRDLVELLELRLIRNFYRDKS